TETLKGASEVFRTRTMDVLKIAFLSSAVLEFFTSISIAITAVYFGFSYIGELNFGYYGAGVTLFAGLFILILAPEFYQPLRDLGTFYHAKQQAVGAA
ncbi:cysteine/glutathione ABC transporter permease/ATP-binding protein CydD, partial [Escherichia coli]|nr:cysteine/glutathione ABC transporter permease/ATP-binding protein CydD [Escherichia coli]